MTDETVNDDGAGDGTEGPPEPIEGQEELETGGDAESGEIETDEAAEGADGGDAGDTIGDAPAETTEGHETAEDGAEDGENVDGAAEEGAELGETGDAGDGSVDVGGDESDGDAESAAHRVLKELHDDIEAALFAAQDLADAPEREKAVIVQKLEAALTWTKKALEKS